jgi:hypothetical protein
VRDGAFTIAFCVVELSESLVRAGENDRIGVESVEVWLRNRRLELGDRGVRLIQEIERPPEIEMNGDRVLG